MDEQYESKSIKVKNKQTIFISLLLIMSEIINRQLFLFIVVFYLIVSIFKEGILKKAIKINLYLISIFMIGFSVGMIQLAINSYNLRDFVRDISMFFTPIIYITYGIYVRHNKNIDIDNIYAAIIKASIIIEVRHLFLIFFNIQTILSGGSIRGIGGGGSYITTIAIIILLFYKNNTFSNSLNKKINKYVLISFLLILFVCYLSRTHIVILLIGVLINIFVTKKIKYNQIIGLIVFIAISAPIVINIIPKDTLNEFINKTFNSFNEISSDLEYWTQKSINDNWRGYEVYRTKELFKEANPSEVLFGFGFGKRVDLNISIYLGKELFTSIPILHNGYYYILLKTGIIGLIIYIIFFIKMALKNYKQIYSDNFDSKLLCIISLSILFSTLVVSGIYNKGSIFVFCLIIGLSFYNKNQNHFINE